MNDNFKLVDGMGGLEIHYSKYPLKLCSFFITGFGIDSDTYKLAKEILDHLNSIPFEVPYPYNQKET